MDTNEHESSNRNADTAKELREAFAQNTYKLGLLAGAFGLTGQESVDEIKAAIAAKKRPTEHTDHTEGKTTKHTK